MLISLCGTPGTGKTTASSLLDRSGTDVLSVNDLIREERIEGVPEPSSGSVLIDTDILRATLESWASAVSRRTVLEGHLSYLAPSDLCLVLRVHPDVLHQRLKARGYPEGKCMENAEAEGVGTILSWALREEVARLGGRVWEDLPRGCGIVLEKDVTRLSPHEVRGWVQEMMDAYLEKELIALAPFRPGSVDWLEVISGWY